MLHRGAMPSLRVNGDSYDYAWWGAGSTRAPVLLVHEAAGHARGWGDFPLRLAEATDRRVYAYSRLGWGQSDALTKPLARGELEREALDILPVIRSALRLERAVLAGFRDGASIALIHAGAAATPTEGVMAIAPLVFVDEPLRQTLRGNAARGLPASLTAMQSDPERTFTEWTALWTSKAFADWKLDDFIPGVTCPALGLRGAEDAFTSPAHLERLASLVKHLEVVQLPGCRHQPHLDKPAAVITAMSAFLRAVP